MSSDRFVSERKGAWQRLEDLLGLLERTSLRRLEREEVRELGRIYRRTASDLAIARAESRDPRLVGYLNSLVIRAHGRIYRADASEGGRRLWRFFAEDFPSTFRRTWRYTLVSFLVFTTFAAHGSTRSCPNSAASTPTRASRYSTRARTGGSGSTRRTSCGAASSW